VSGRPSIPALDPLTTHSRIFDRARGITPGEREAIQWVASNSGWLKRSRIGWHGVRDGRHTQEALPGELVKELTRLGVLEIYTGRGDRLDAEWDELAELARLVQVA
jgi:hypothetical protein